MRRGAAGGPRIHSTETRNGPAGRCVVGGPAASGAQRGNGPLPPRNKKDGRRPARLQRPLKAARLVDRLVVALATQSECDYRQCDRDSERRTERAH